MNSQLLSIRLMVESHGSWQTWLDFPPPVLAVFVKCSVIALSFLPSFLPSVRPPLKRRWSEPKVTRRVLTRGTFLEPADCLSITPEPGGAFYPGRRALGPATDTPPSLPPPLSR